MHLFGLTFAFLLPSLVQYTAAIPSAIAPSPDSYDLSDRVNDHDSFSALLYGRDGDEHGHSHGNAAPIVHLNETEVLLYHDPTPPSYWSIDIDDPDSDSARHPSLMVLHSLFMTFAFLGALPAGSSWHAIPPLLF